MVVIRQEKPEDLTAIRWVNKQAFKQPDDAFMAIELEEGAFQGVTGTVKYQPEFNGF